MVTIFVLDPLNALQDRRNSWPLQREAFILPLLVAVVWYLIGGSSPKATKLPFLSPITFLCFWWVVTERTFLYLLSCPWKALAAYRSTSWTLWGISTVVAGTVHSPLHLEVIGSGIKIIALRCLWIIWCFRIREKMRLWHAFLARTQHSSQWPDFPALKRHHLRLEPTPVSGRRTERRKRMEPSLYSAFMQPSPYAVSQGC